MHKIQWFSACIFLVTVSALAAETEQQLIAVLQSGAAPEKAIACKRLAVCGTKDAVPALAPLLADPQLASWARIALEAIPDPAADDALRDSLGKLKGKLLVGAINSIGVRRDAKAVPALIARLGDADAEVVAAAGPALGRIGGATAADALEKALAARSPEVRSAAAEGCILCAERYLAEGKWFESRKLYDGVYNARVSRQRTLEALRSAIMANVPVGLPQLSDLLCSTDKSQFALGLHLAREISDPKATDILVSELEPAAPERQPLLLAALADRGGEVALKAVLQKTGAGPVATRLAAIRVLKKLGNASCLPVLLAAAVEPDKTVSAAAAEVLADLPGKDVDEALTARLAKADGSVRLALIQIAGQRYLVAAVPALLKAAGDSNPWVRVTALHSLGLTAGMEQLPSLIAPTVADAASATETKIAQEALEAACVRMADRDACAEKLIAAMPQASTPGKCRLLTILRAVGGAKALAAVLSAAKDADEELQDTASRQLGEWMNPEAAPALLELAKTSGKYQTRAVRGYIRIARQFNVPLPQRTDMCAKALPLCQRDEERKLVLQVLSKYTSPEGLALVVPCLHKIGLNADACAAAVAIGEKLIGSHAAEVADAMKQVLAVSPSPDLARRAQALLDKAQRKSTK